MTNSAGAIATVEDHRGKHIVAVEWDGSAMQFYFGEASTAWMHWERAA
jgi:hypothetical protein